MNRRPQVLRTRGTSCGQVTTPSSDASAAKRAISVTRSGEPGTCELNLATWFRRASRPPGYWPAQSLRPADARDLGARPRHHLGRAAIRAVRMDVEHLDAEAGRLDRGAQHLLRAVVKFEIEKNFGAAPAYLANKSGPPPTNSARPTLNIPTTRARRSTSRSASPPSRRSSDTISRSRSAFVALRPRKWPVLGHRSSELMKICRSRSTRSRKPAM